MVAWSEYLPNPEARLLIFFSSHTTKWCQWKNNSNKLKKSTTSSANFVLMRCCWRLL